uniref:Uncharacterized protein n=1 Tax=Anguilla anguilla TaxID=7936 RepID=A0A0E9WWZ3_ANGAN
MCSAFHQSVRHRQHTVRFLLQPHFTDGLITPY